LDSISNPVKISTALTRISMLDTLTLTAQLDSLGAHLPAWPKEPDGGGATGDWIQRGQSYAEALRLWRAQLRNINGLDKSAVEQLIQESHEAIEAPQWDVRVIQYILINMHDLSEHEKDMAATKLIELEGLSAAQLLGASLDLLSTSFIAKGISGIKKALKTTCASFTEQAEILALLTIAIPAIPENASSDFRCWTRKVSLHKELTRLLNVACHPSQEDNSANLIDQLWMIADTTWDQSIEFGIVKKRWLTSLSETEPVIAGMASIPSRRELLRVSLESILPQVDQIELVLNGYGDIPEWLCDERITVVTDSQVGKHADNAKFLGMAKYKECTYFSVDDDILYPKNYIAHLVDAISLYRGDVAVGVHGSLVHSRGNAFLNRRTHASWKALDIDMPCSYVGTGTLAIRRSIMPPSPFSIFHPVGASDLFLARYLKFHHVPVICVQRPEGWLRDLPNSSGLTLWKQAQETHVLQDALLEDSGPWGVSDIMNRCKGETLNLLGKDLAAGLEAAQLVALGKQISTPVSETLQGSRSAQKAFKFYAGYDYLHELKSVLD
jgi:hypothetical protein